MNADMLAPACAAIRESLQSLLAALAFGTGACTILFSAASVAAARRFRSRRPCAEGALPPLTVLKPIKGTDGQMYENLASFLSQDYPRFQVLFALQNPEDPALDVLKRLRRDFPAADMEIVISKNRIGYNPKINNLANAYGLAKHELLVISDSDVRVGPRALRRLAAPFSDPTLGLQTCFYRAPGAAGLSGALESLSVNAQFLPQALVAAFLVRMRFAMGAVMAVRRSAFESSGGLLNLSDHLADDFLLGRSIEAAGYRIGFSDIVVDSVPAAFSLREHFSHLVRWSRTIRVCNPAGYLGSCALYGIPFLLLHLAFSGPDAGASRLLAACALARIASVGWIHRAYLGNPGILPQLPFVPLADVIQFAAWLSGFRSRPVLWRGESYLVATNGRLVPAEREPAAVAPAGVA